MRMPTRRTGKPDTPASSPTDGHFSHTLIPRKKRRPSHECATEGSHECACSVHAARIALPPPPLRAHAHAVAMAAAAAATTTTRLRTTSVGSHPLTSRDHARHLSPLRSLPSPQLVTVTLRAHSTRCLPPRDGNCLAVAPPRAHAHLPFAAVACAVMLLTGPQREDGGLVGKRMVTY